MGKGTIISGGENGQYQVQVNYDTRQYTKLISMLNSSKSDFETQIADETDTEKLNILKIQLLSVQKRIDYLENNFPDDETISAWCADLTTDLTGEVGTIEVPGEVGTVQIQPGYDSNAVYNAARDGQRVPTVAQNPAQAFYNLAMLPGWQKWKPTYRYGTITDISGEAASVTLEDIRSSQQSLEINQETELTGVPFEYMSCDGAAFAVDDEVLIQFEGQDFSSPKIVGFKDNPKPCNPYVYIRASVGAGVSGVEPLCIVWDTLTDAMATEIPLNAGGFASFPCACSLISDWYSARTEAGTDLFSGDGFRNKTGEHLSDYILDTCTGHDPETGCGGCSDSEGTPYTSYDRDGALVDNTINSDVVYYMCPGAPYSPANEMGRTETKTVSQRFDGYDVGGFVLTPQNNIAGSYSMGSEDATLVDEDQEWVIDGVTSCKKGYNYTATITTPFQGGIELSVQAKGRPGDVDQYPYEECIATFDTDTHQYVSTVNKTEFSKIIDGASCVTGQFTEAGVMCHFHSAGYRQTSRTANIGRLYYPFASGLLLATMQDGNEFPTSEWFTRWDAAPDVLSDVSDMKCYLSIDLENGALNMNPFEMAPHSGLTTACNGMQNTLINNGTWDDDKARLAEFDIQILQ